MTPLTAVLALSLAAPTFIPRSNAGPQPPGAACADAAHRAFDFWVGDWIVHNAQGIVFAENRITTDLDGCAVLEHWNTRAGGNRGRSINSYDAASGLWHQTWVTEATVFGFPLRMAGGLLPDGRMDLKGVRHPVWNRDAVWLDEYIWTPISADRVLQEPILDIPSSNIHIHGRITYERTNAFPAFAPAPTSKCTPQGDSGQIRRLDSVVGSYQVVSGDGKHLGKSEIALDGTVSNCLIEEAFKGEARYRATGWLYYDPVEDRYYRTLVDNRGNRVEVGGQFATDGNLVLTGPLPDGSGLLRMTLTTSAGNLRFDWELSSDGGASFTEEETLLYLAEVADE
jgi:hypothetical protein